jgi:hypothetical protein
MLNQHPITPPPELLDEWCMDPTLSNWRDIATQAAQWGADQELQACCTAIDEVPGWWADSRHLRHVRRPKPPSLKEQALSELEEIMTELHDETGSAFTASAIRRALEALPE